MLFGNVKAAAVYLGIEEGTLRSLLKSDNPPPFQRLSLRRFVFESEALDTWFDEWIKGVKKPAPENPEGRRV